MDNYEIYRRLESTMQERKLQLSELNKELEQIKEKIVKLEELIEEDSNGLIIIFDYLIAS